MGLRSSKPSSREKAVKIKKASSKQPTRKDSDNSDLDDEDCNLVTVPLDTTASDKRLERAKELIASGRPISISLEATTEDPKENKSHNPAGGWEDDEARKKWKDQLGLMRHFYDWEEIPLDFFIDTYVGGGGEPVRRRRLSLSLVTEPSPDAAKPQPAPEEIRILPNQAQSKPVTSPSDASRTRSASVAVPPSSGVRQQPPLILAPAIPEMASVAAASSPTNRTAPALPERPVDKPRPSETAGRTLPERPANRIRAASVAIGETFPLPTASAIQKQAAPATPHAPSSAEMEKLLAAVAPSKKLAGVIAHHSERPSSVRSDQPSRAEEARNPVQNVIDQEGRPRRASATSIDQVYGRLGKPGGLYDRFEVENPVVHGSPQPQRRPTTTDKKPEQFRQMSPVIDPTQFATERRNTRTSVHRSNVEKAVFGDEGRVSSTSTRLESKSSGDPRAATMSDWM